MFTHFRPASKKQAPKPPQNKNSVYIKYGYFMGNPMELAEQRQAEALVPLPEADETVINITENKGSDALAVCSVEVLARPKGIANSCESINKKPFILYRKSKGAKQAAAAAVIVKNTICICLLADCTPHNLQGFVNIVSICCRGGPFVS